MNILRSAIRPSGPVAAGIPLFAAGILAAVIIGCENPQGTPNGNSPPETRLANVPANDTIAQYISQGVIPQQTLFWAGDDPDGFVVAFRYTWTDIYNNTDHPTDTTTLLNLTTIGGLALDTLAGIPPTTARNPGSLFRIYNFLATLDPEENAVTKDLLFDSLATLRPFVVPYLSGAIATDSLVGLDPLHNEAPTKGIFIFDSPADSNLHRFEVWSIDNTGATDPTSAKTYFWTLPSPGLTVSISAGPTLTNTSFVLTYPTERTPGLTFSFGAVDPSTNERDFSWSVDDTLHWSEWNPQAFATITAIDFHSVGTDTHTIYLKGRNKWGVISPVATRDFKALVPAIDDPSWPKKTLVINHCRITAVTPPAPVPEWLPPVDSADVIAFYTDVLTQIGKTPGVDFDIYTSASHGYRFPDRLVLSTYTSVMLIAEQDLPDWGLGTVTRIDASKQALLSEYLNIGGKLIFSGPPNIRLLFGTLATSTWEVWANDIFHIVTSVSSPPLTFLQNDAFDFVGATGILGYPDIRVDTTKLPASAGGAMANIAANFPRGFGQTICEFDSRSNSPIFEGVPLGVRYLAPPAVPPASPTYSVVYYGFPLYYMMKDDVIAVLEKSFDDINE